MLTKRLLAPLLALTIISACTSKENKWTDRAFTGMPLEEWSFSIDGESWENVEIPHTYNNIDGQSKSYYRGTAHYKTTLPAASAQTPRYLIFEGVGQGCYVILGGDTLRFHSGGYTPFYVDITGKEGRELEVFCDNFLDLDRIPLTSDFNKNGGLHYPVWLLKCPAVHFSPEAYGYYRMHVSQNEVSDEKACGEDVLSEVCELFPSEYIHIGGDECPKASWEKCPKCQAKIRALGLKDKDGESAEHYLQSYVITRVEKFLNAKGRKIIGWDEILEGGIAPNATIMSWHGDKPGWKAAAMGHDAIMTPNYCMYFDKYHSTDESKEPFGIGGYLPVEKVYAYEPCFDGMCEEEKAHILGVQANMWTEYIADADHLYYMLLPRLAALSEVQWCQAERKDWERFYGAAEDYCRMYETMGYNWAEHIFHAKGEIEVDPQTRSAVIELWAQDDAPIRYTLNGKTPTRFSKLYRQPLTLTESAVLKAVAFRKDAEPREFSCSFVSHKGLGAELSYSERPHRKYRYGLPGCLTDGLRGTEVFRTASWAAWRGTPVDLVIDMKTNETVSSVAAGVLRNQSDNIFFPESLTVSVSSDGENFVEVASQKYDAEIEAPNFLGELTLTFPETSARYVKLTMVPLARIPQWRAPEGNAAYAFIDEIIVR